MDVTQYKMKCQELIDVKRFLKNVEHDNARLKLTIDELNDKLKQKDNLVKVLRDNLAAVNEEFANSSHEAASCKSELERVKEQLSNVKEHNEQLRRKSELYLSELEESKLMNKNLDVNYEPFLASNEIPGETEVTLSPSFDLETLEREIRRKTEHALSRSTPSGSEVTHDIKQRSASLKETKVNASNQTPTPKPRSMSARTREMRPLSELLAEIRETAGERLSSIKQSSANAQVDAVAPPDPLSTRAEELKAHGTSSVSISSTSDSFATATSGGDSEERIKAFEHELRQEKERTRTLSNESYRMKRELAHLRTQNESLKAESQRATILENELDKLRSSGSSTAADTSLPSHSHSAFAAATDLVSSTFGGLTSRLLSPPKKPSRTFTSDNEEMFEFVEHSHCGIPTSALNLSKKQAKRFNGDAAAAQMLIENLEKQNAIHVKRIKDLQARLRDYEHVALKSSQMITKVCRKCQETSTEHLDRLKAELAAKTDKVNVLEAKLEMYNRQWKW